ncbi:MAG: site-specific integrase [Alphaproteobacteria bacterium]|nr:site-specific integrase [Alphaproteobacteria bacterium]
MASIVLNKSNLEKVINKVKESGKNVTYSCSNASSLYVRIGKRDVLFFVDKRFKGIDYRKDIGHYPYISISQAKDDSAKILADILNGKYKRNDLGNKVVMRFDDLFNFYYEKHAKPNKKSCEHDKQLYNAYVRPFMGKKKADKIDKDLVLRVLDNVRKTKSVFNHIISLLSKVFNVLIENNLMSENYVKGISKYPVKGITRYLSDAELASLKRVLNSEKYNGHYIKLFTLIALNTGLRKTNILSILNENIDFEKGNIFIEDTKNGEGITVPISNEIMELIREYQASCKKPCKYLFYNRWYNGYITDPKRSWGILMDDAGISGFRMHDLRHTFATYLVKNDIPLSKVQKALGHKTISMTLKYAHLSNSDIKDDILNTVSCFNI